jgi:hypothetical protein
VTPSSLPRSAPAIPATPPKAGIPRSTRIPGGRAFRKALLVLAGIGIGALATHFVHRNSRDGEIPSEVGSPVPSGPWGELYRVPFTIAAPEELLSIQKIEARGTHWVFRNFTASELANLFESAGVPADQRDALLDPAVAHYAAADIELTPTPQMVVTLPGRARLAIYRQLAQFPENRADFHFIHKDTLGDRFDDSGVSGDTLALFHTCCCEHGDYLVLGGLPALLARIPDYAEKLRFMKALTRQKTMLLSIRVTKETDIKALENYWAKGQWAPSIRSILESVGRIPGGTFMNVMTLLPPLPAAELNFFPVVHNNPANSPAPVRDCHWTSLNFFRDPSEPQYTDPSTFSKEVAANYYSVSSDPRYGDVLIFSKPDGEIVHSAVFIADDIVFTKNGATAIFPWMLSTIPDLLKQYSFLAPDDQKLTLRYYRNKDL